MEKLVQLVMERSGITEEQARVAVAAVVEHVKSKLPPMLAGQVDSIIEGDASGVQSLLGKSLLGNLFGPK